MECTGSPAHLHDSVAERLLVGLRYLDVVFLHDLVELLPIFQLDLVVVRGLQGILIFLPFDVGFQFDFDVVLNVSEVIVEHQRVSLDFVFEELEPRFAFLLV